MKHTQDDTDLHWNLNELSVYVDEIRIAIKEAQILMRNQVYPMKCDPEITVKRWKEWLETADSLIDEMETEIIVAIREVEAEE